MFFGQCCVELGFWSNRIETKNHAPQKNKTHSVEIKGNNTTWLVENTYCGAGIGNIRSPIQALARSIIFDRYLSKTLVHSRVCVYVLQ